MAQRRWKWQWQVQRQRVSMGFWGEQCYIPPYPQSHLLIRKSVTPHLPPSPICPLRSPQDLMSLYLWTRWWRLPLQLLLQLQRRPSPPICNPFAFSWGVSSEYTDARLRTARRVHQPPMLLFAHMYAKCTWGWGWCAPLAASPSSTQTLSGTTRKAILINKVREKRGSINWGILVISGMG